MLMLTYSYVLLWHKYRPTYRKEVELVKDFCRLRQKLDILLAGVKRSLM